MRSILAAGAAAFALLLAGCGAAGPSSAGEGEVAIARPTLAPITEPTVPAGPTTAGDADQEAVPTEVVPGVGDAPAVVKLIADLQRRGIEPVAADVSRVEFLDDAPGQAYQFIHDRRRADMEWFLVHLYPSAEAAGARHDQVRQGLANPVADPPAPPHAFQCGAVIALYLGRDEQVTQALTELCGPQFAGSQ